MGSSCAAWQLQLIILFLNYFVYLKVAKRGDLQSPHHTHTRCNNVRWWAWDGLIMVMISQYIQILSHYVAHPKWIWRDMSTMHQLKKRNGGRTICALTIAEKDEALSFASGSAVSPSSQWCKGYLQPWTQWWDRPGALHFSQAPWKCQFLQTPGCTLSSKVLMLLRVEISWLVSKGPSYTYEYSTGAFLVSISDTVK